jgi:hypothetical protein
MSLVSNANRLPRKETLTKTGSPSWAAAHLSADPPVVGPADVAALAVNIMTNTSFTGATFDIDGGQQFVEG